MPRGLIFDILAENSDYSFVVIWNRIGFVTANLSSIHFFRVISDEDRVEISTIAWTVISESSIEGLWITPGEEVWPVFEYETQTDGIRTCK